VNPEQPSEQGEGKLHERRSAAGTEAILEGRNNRQLQWREKEEQRGNKSDYNRRSDRRAHLPVRQHGNSAIVIGAVSVRVDQLVKPFGGREDEEREKKRETNHRPGPAISLVPKRQRRFRFSHCGAKFMSSARRNSKQFLCRGSHLLQNGLRVRDPHTTALSDSPKRLFQYHAVAYRAALPLLGIVNLRPDQSKRARDRFGPGSVVSIPFCSSAAA